jgi:hypothetical protein
VCDLATGKLSNSADSAAAAALLEALRHWLTAEVAGGVTYACSAAHLVAAQLRNPLLRRVCAMDGTAPLSLHPGHSSDAAAVLQLCLQLHPVAADARALPELLSRLLPRGVGVAGRRTCAGWWDAASVRPEAVVAVVHTAARALGAVAEADAALVRRGLRQLACTTMLTLHARVAGGCPADRVEALLWRVLAALLHTRALRGAAADAADAADAAEAAEAEAREAEAAARALTARVLASRFRDSRALATVRRLVAQVFSQNSAAAVGGGDASCTPAAAAAAGWAEWAAETFDRVVTHSQFARAMLSDHAATPPLPPRIAAVSFPLASLLAVLPPPATLAQYASSSGGGEGSSSSSSSSSGGEEAEATAAGAGERAERVVARRVKVELVRLLRALLRVQAAAADRAESAGDQGGRGGTRWQPDETGRLMAVLLAAYGATTSRADRATLVLLRALELRRTADVPGLSSLRWLWGAAAASCVLAAASGSIGGGAVQPVSADEAERVLREEALVDPRRAALAVLFHDAADPEHADSDADSDGGGEAQSEWGVAEEAEAEAEAALREAAYDPAFVLPFAAAAVHAKVVDVRQCCQWGLLSMALGALASETAGRRQQGYQLLAAVMAALPEAEFKEKAQVSPPPATVIRLLRIGRVGFGNGRQRMALERGTTPHTFVAYV